MKPDHPLPCSQEPATGPYTERAGIYKYEKKSLLGVNTV
jgi:hypothetical protein